MKPVHPATKRAIIRQYERSTYVTVKIGPHKLLEMTLAQLRDGNRMQGLPAELTFFFDAGSKLFLS